MSNDEAAEPPGDHLALSAAPPSAGVRINKLTFSNGDEVPMLPTEVLVIVGPNNVGKSAALQNIFRSLMEGTTAPNVCRPTFELTGSWEELEPQLRPHLKPSSGGDPSYSGPEFDVHGPSARYHWEQKGPLQGLAPYFARLLDTGSRLNACNPAPSHAVGRVNPSNAFQALYEDPELQAKVSDTFRAVFDVGLVFNPMPGSEICLYVGNQPPLAVGESTNSKGHLKKIVELPRLHQQGDGMKSFAAMLLAIMVFPRHILLIDEPEAFLHPPQERRIGTLLSEVGPISSQIVISTHSQDVIQGLLARAPDRVSIVRLTRDGATNKAKLLPNEKVAALWKSPILRYSNILSGLFHEGVVIAESDGDCRFFEAVQEVLRTPTRKPDLFYTHGGGKDRMPTLIAALSALDVPVRAVADVDILREEKLLKEIVERLGGDWATISADWSATKKAIEERKNWFRAGDLRSKIDGVLGKLDKEAVVGKDTLLEITRLGRQTSPWEEVKRNGLPGPLAGDAAVRTKSLLEKLSTVGLFVLPVGELENFVKTVGGHGPRWVEGALAKNLPGDPELACARDFVRRLLNSFSGQAAAVP